MKKKKNPPSQIKVWPAAWKHLKVASKAAKATDMPMSMIALASTAILAIPIPSKEEPNEINKA